MLRQQIALAVGPFALDKLDNAHLFAVPHGAQRGAESGGGFAFAVAGKDHNDAARFRRGSDARVNLLFQPLLPLLMAIVAHYSAAPGLRPGCASKLMPVLRRLSSPMT